MFYQNKFCCRWRRECIGIRANCGKYPPYFLFFLLWVLRKRTGSRIACPSPAASILPSHLAASHLPHKFTISLTFGGSEGIIVVLYNSCIRQQLYGKQRRFWEEA